MLGVAAIALLLSTLTDSAVAAALGTIGFLIASTVLLGLDAADSIRPYLLTRYWLAFVDLFRDPIRWRDVVHGVLAQLGLPGRVRRSGLGQLRHQGHQQVTSRGALGATRPSGAAQRRQHHRVRGQTAVRRGRCRADVLHVDVEGPVELGRVRAASTVSVLLRAHGDPARSGRRLVARVQPAQQIAVGHQLLARRRAAAGRLRRQRGHVGAVVR